MADSPVGQIASSPSTPLVGVPISQAAGAAISPEPPDNYLSEGDFCSYKAIVKRTSSCGRYWSWLPVIDGPYLTNPSAQQQVDSILEMAHRLRVLNQELKAVYHAARPNHSFTDRLARLKVYLFFKEVSRIPPQRSGDLNIFAARVLRALKQPGEVNIQAVDGIVDESGFPLSGEYRELDDRTVRLSQPILNKGSEDWAKYVVYHELRHWFSFRIGKPRKSYEAEELEATYWGMKTLLAADRGQVNRLAERLQSGGLQPHLDKKISSLENGIRSLPAALQLSFSLVWEHLRKNFVDEHLRPAYLSKTLEVVRREGNGGKPNKTLLQEAGHSLQRQRFAARLVWEMEGLLEAAKQGGRSSSCPSDRCGVVLGPILALAVEGQTALAITKLNQCLKAYQQSSFPTEAVLGAP